MDHQNRIASLISFLGLTGILFTGCGTTSVKFHSAYIVCPVKVNVPFDWLVQDESPSSNTPSSDERKILLRLILIDSKSNKPVSGVAVNATIEEKECNEITDGNGKVDFDITKLVRNQEGGIKLVFHCRKGSKVSCVDIPLDGSLIKVLSVQDLQSGSVCADVILPYKQGDDVSTEGRSQMVFTISKKGSRISNIDVMLFSQDEETYAQCKKDSDRFVVEDLDPFLPKASYSQDIPLVLKWWTKRNESYRAKLTINGDLARLLCLKRDERKVAENAKKEKEQAEKEKANDTQPNKK